MALKPMSTFSVPMISVTSCSHDQQNAYYLPATPSYTWVIWLHNGNLDALFLEEALGLSQVQRCMVWRSVPLHQSACLIALSSSIVSAHQFVKKVILSVDMVAMLQKSIHSTLTLIFGEEGKGMSLAQVLP